MKGLNAKTLAFAGPYHDNLLILNVNIFIQYPQYTNPLVALLGEKLSGP